MIFFVFVVIRWTSLCKFLSKHFIYSPYSSVTETCSHTLRSKVTSLCTLWHLRVGEWKHSCTNFNVDTWRGRGRSLMLRPIYWTGKITQSPINTMFCEFQNQLDARKYIKKTLANGVERIRTYRTAHPLPHNMAFPEGCQIPNGKSTR